MKKENKTLSEKYSEYYNGFQLKDVKEFMKKTEEDIIEHRNIAQYNHPESKVIVALSNEIIEIIKKRVGKDLI